MTKQDWTETLQTEGVAAFRSGTGVLEPTQEAIRTFLEAYAEAPEMAFDDPRGWEEAKPFVHRWLRIQGMEAARAARREKASSIEPRHVLVGIERGIRRENSITVPTSFCRVAEQRLVA